MNTDVYKNNYIFYKKYHKSKYNILVHRICIPIIVWSLFGIVNAIGEHIHQNSIYNLYPSIIIYSFYILFYYLISAKRLFKYTLCCYTIILLLSIANYKYSNLSIYITVQILGWIAQIISHKYIEGNAPALSKGIIRSILVAPIFIVDELIDHTQYY